MSDGARLQDQGFAIVSGPFNGADLDSSIKAYERAVETAQPHEIRIGRTSTRVNGLLDRAPELAAIFTHPPLLAAAASLIGGPFKLSAFHSRSVHPGATAQAMHQDVAPDRDGWPLLGFIFTIDAFTIENGATRFLPASARLTELPPGLAETNFEHACGPAGALLLFDGSVWHGHGANITSGLRRSVQGALIPKAATAAIDHRHAVRPEVWAALPRQARQLMEA
jgi:ectoine hydroxylase-related dioxygenase (phytanoyl-CoA dioxygenase family)